MVNLLAVMNSRKPTYEFINKLLVIILLTVTLFSCTNENLELVVDGGSNYEIVLSSTATISQANAAEDLRHYLSLISEVEFYIVDESSLDAAKKKIYVGNFKNESLVPQEISILSDDGNIYISGGSDEAIQNTITEFLETYLGCRWYAPGVEKIPTKKTISIPEVSFSYVPEITTRTVHSRLFYADSLFAERLKVTHVAFPKYVPEARVHTFGKFLPEEQFYESHPEYYAWRGDKRLPTQLCLTNKKVLEIVQDSVAALFERYPEASVVSVSQDDNQQHCQCENCSAIDLEEGSPAGTMIRFVNEVAKAFPDKTISTLAYQYTRKPCKTRPEKNVLITLCSIECDRSRPIGEKCTDFADDLKGWGKLTKNIRIWDYTTQFTNFFAPFPNLLTLQPNVQLFRDNNAKWIFEQHSNNHSELFELRSYILAKLLWNPDVDLELLIADFVDGYYEEAGPFVARYIDLVHDKIEEDDDFFLFLYGDPSEAFSSYLSPELLMAYVGFFDKAEEAVIAKPEILNRVKLARMGIDFAVLEASRKNMSETLRLLAKDEKGKEIPNPKVAKLLDDFVGTCTKNDITLMNEMGFTVGEYGANYLSAIKVAQRPNKAKGKRVTTLSKPKKYANEDPMVLTDGALGGSSFYSNWLGYEGNDMEVILDLGKPIKTSKVTMAFLQVTNHIVFFPKSVTYYGSLNNVDFTVLGTVGNAFPLGKKSKINDIQYFNLDHKPTMTRYIKVKAENTNTPYWHHAAGLPSWVFADEIIVE